MNYRSSAAFSPTKSLKKTIHQMPSRDEVSPGPIYNVSQMADQQHNVSHSIGKSQRYNINHGIQNTPSPVHYNQPQSIKNKGFTIPKSQANPQANQNPDPGCYQPENTVVKPKSLKFSMGSRYPSIMDDINSHPGPGHYQSQKSLPILQKSKNKKETFFGTGTRFKESGNQAGVGDYQIISKQTIIKHHMTIGKSQRTNVVAQVTPAPTDYNKKSVFQDSIDRKLGKSISARQKNCFENLDIAAHAFINYTNPQIHLINTSRKFSIGKAKREVFVGKDTPGPTDYINDKFLKRNGSHAVIPTAVREWQYGQENVPGPGSYQVNNNNKKGYTVPRSKSQVDIINQNPGVGRYMINNPDKTIKTSVFPKSARTNFISKIVAGVGDYNITEVVKTKGTMGKAQRFKRQAYPKPGPGDYHISSIIGYKSPKV